MVPRVRVAVLCLPALLAGAACAPVARGGEAPPSPSVYVASGGDGTITRLDAGNAYRPGVTFRVASGPRQLALGRAGRDDRLLVLGSGAGGVPTLTLVTGTRNGWAERPIAIEPGARPSLVRSDGRGLAAVVYAPPPGGDRPAPSACRLAVIDLRLGTVAGTHDLCEGDETVLDLVLGQSEREPTIYAAIWAGPRRVDGRWTAGVGRVIALRVATGRRTASYVLGGVPGHLAFWQGHPAAERSLYVVETMPGSGDADGQTEHVPGGDRRWQLLRLDSATLLPEATYPLPDTPHPPAALAVAPDGRHGYVLAGHDARSGGTVVLGVDLITGSAGRFVVLPGGGVELAVVDEYLLVTHPGGGEVWVIDRRERRIARTLDIGQRPLTMAVPRP